MMSPYLSTVQIQCIIFENVSTEALIRVHRINDGSFCELLISFAELNALLNQLQIDNPNVVVTELFEELSIGSNYSQYVLDAQQTLKQSKVNLSFLSPDEPRQWIRA